MRTGSRASEHGQGAKVVLAFGTSPRIGQASISDLPKKRTLLVGRRCGFIVRASIERRRLRFAAVGNVAAEFAEGIAAHGVVGLIESLFRFNSLAFEPAEPRLLMEIP